MAAYYDKELTGIWSESGACSGPFATTTALARVLAPINPYMSVGLMLGQCWLCVGLCVGHMFSHDGPILGHVGRRVGPMSVLC